MHTYLYDSFLNSKKYESILARIETRITDLGLNGKIIRLNIANSATSAVENEIKNGAKTIIAVGENKLFNDTINSIAKLISLKIAEKNIPMGFIPIGKNTSLAASLGITLENACNVLSSRRIMKMDLGLANDRYFLMKAAITSAGTKVEIDKNYSIEIKGSGELGVLNIPTPENIPEKCQAKPDDGVLELFIKTKTSKRFFPISSVTHKSIFSFSKLLIQNQNYPLILDEAVEVKLPAEIKTAKEKICLIVGKDRVF